MKLVREHINEKFTEDSDPIKDMGIGLLDKLKKDFIRHCSWKKISKSSVTYNQLLSFCLDNDYDIYAIEYLLEAGANPNLGNSLLKAVNRKKNQKEILELLFKYGANPKANRSSAFLWAVFLNKTDIAQMFLDRGVDISVNAGSALTQLMDYSFTRYKPTIKWLIEKGVKTTGHNYYALRQALKYKDYELADIFMKDYSKERKISIK
jgi:ankyrin repeat protein